jgi:hypothetical protein
MEVIKGFVSHVLRFSFCSRSDDVTMPSIDETPLLRLQSPSLFKQSAGYILCSTLRPCKWRGRGCH